jgi:O-methyltransferase
MKLLSDQVSESEVTIILRELERTITRQVSGDVVELGCYVGTTSVFLAKAIEKTNKKLYCYDSFEGLPEKSSADASPAGTQFKKGELLTTKKQFIQNLKKANVRMPIVKKAWFSDLTPKDLPSKIAFAFLDGDYYQSIKDSLKLVWPKLVGGAVVVVDDYANEALPGAAVAVDEWLLAHKARLSIEQSLAIVKPD